MVTSALLLLILAAEGASTTARAQSVDALFLDRYRALIDLYRSGQVEASVNAVLRLEQGAVHQAVDRYVVLARKGLLTDSTLDAAFFRAASMLHADAAFQCWRTAREKEAAPQLALARRLVDASDPVGAAPSPFRRRWYVATALVVSSLIVSHEALDYFEDAVSALPNDLPLLTAAGWFSERLSNMAAAPGSTLADQQVLHRRYRQAAERFLTAALKAHPGSTEAALRRARLEVLAGHEGEARQRLVPLLARDDVEPSVAYVGRLLLGGIYEREGNRLEAERLYREAIALDELAQSARLALSHLLYVSGDSARAADVIEPLVTRGAERARNDPWSDYQLAYVPVGRALLDDLRKAVQW